MSNPLNDPHGAYVTFPAIVTVMDSIERPAVMLPRPASQIHRQPVDFIPVREGMDTIVRGIAQVIRLDTDCYVGVIYTSPTGLEMPAVYWLDQVEVDALFKP